MFRFFVFIIVIYLLYKIFSTVRQVKTEKNQNHLFNSSPAVGEDLVEDPVCHTYVPIIQALKKEISGKSYYFCSQQCSEKYLSEKNN